MSLVYDFIENSFRKLIFPIERPKGSSKFTSFFLSFDDYLEEQKVYVFYAVQNGQLETQYLYRVSHNLFVVPHADYGNILFGVSIISDSCEYVGSSKEVAKASKFIRLFPLDNDELNYLCEYHKFFFVGYVDRSIEQVVEELF
ncbi:hypothetical protein ABMX68_21205 [Vibrio vulnificus]|uniref:hypothetical protein n=1 Tax=Vibrio vulnificus TaxID=672 RepID=UPI004059326E